MRENRFNFRPRVALALPRYHVCASRGRRRLFFFLFVSLVLIVFKILRAHASFSRSVTVIKCVVQLPWQLYPLYFKWPLPFFDFVCFFWFYSTSSKYHAIVIQSENHGLFIFIYFYLFFSIAFFLFFFQLFDFNFISIPQIIRLKTGYYWFELSKWRKEKEEKKTPLKCIPPHSSKECYMLLFFHIFFFLGWRKADLFEDILHCSDTIERQKKIFFFYSIESQIGRSTRLLIDNLRQLRPSRRTLKTLDPQITTQKKKKGKKKFRGKKKIW